MRSEHHTLKRRAEAKADIDCRIAACRKCQGLNIPCKTMSAPAWGSLRAKVVIVGQSLHSYNKDTEPQIPFIGPHQPDSGTFLWKAINLSNATDKDILITNAVHCHPPNNRPSLPEELENCYQFLKEEVELVKPKLVIALGNQAAISVFRLRKDLPWLNVWKTCHPSYAMRFASFKERDKWVTSLMLKLNSVCGK